MYVLSQLLKMYFNWVCHDSIFSNTYVPLEAGTMNFHQCILSASTHLADSRYSIKKKKKQLSNRINVEVIYYDNIKLIHPNFIKETQTMKGKVPRLNHTGSQCLSQDWNSGAVNSNPEILFSLCQPLCAVTFHIQLNRTRGGGCR